MDDIETREPQSLDEAKAIITILRARLIGADEWVAGLHRQIIEITQHSGRQVAEFRTELDDIRLRVKYLQFDLACTRRERDELAEWRKWHD